jgi:hypothetical protein
MESELPAPRAAPATSPRPIRAVPDAAAATRRGWLLAAWYRAHADRLRIQTIIWQGRQRLARALRLSDHNYGIPPCRKRRDR